MTDQSESAPFLNAFCAAVFANDILEAKLHGEQLLADIEIAKSMMALTELEHYLILCRLHYYDNQHALMYMRKPVIDPQATAATWLPYFAPLQVWAQDRGVIVHGVGNAAFSPKLRSLLTKLQEYVYIQRAAVPAIQQRHGTGLVSSSAVHESHLLTSQLFKHLGLSMWQTETTIDITLREMWATECILVTAALAFLACAINAPLPNLHLAVRGATAFAALRSLLECASSATNVRNQQIYQFP